MRNKIITNYSESEEDEANTSASKHLTEYLGNKDSYRHNARKMENSVSDSDSGVSTKSKVTVLQDVQITPPKVKTHKQKLQELYPGLTKIKTNISLDFSDLEDVCLFRIPKSIDLHLLKNLSINLKESKVDIGKKRLYVVKSAQKIPDPAFVIADNNKIIHFKSNIFMEEDVGPKKEPKIAVKKKSVVPLPDNLKVRHPLFGSDFKPKIRLSKEVEQKLDEAIADIMRIEKKSKKKKKKYIDKDKQEDEIMFNLFNSHKDSGAIKKESSYDSAFSSAGSLNDVTTKKKMLNGILNNVKEELTDHEQSSSSIGIISKRSKKKNKKNIIEETLNEIKQEILTENESDNYVESISFKKKKRKKKNKEVSENRSLNMEESLISDNLNLSIIETEMNEMTPRKTHKRKNKIKPELNQHSESENNLISEILNDLKDDLSSAKSSKKKRKSISIESESPIKKIKKEMKN